MKKGKRLFISLVVLTVAVVFCVPATYAGHDQGGCKQGGHQKKLDEKVFYKAHFILMNQEELGLTEEQVATIKDLKIATKKDLIKREAEIDLIAVDIKTALWQDTIDVAAVNALIDQKYMLKKEKTKALVAAYATLKNTLSTEQRQAFKEVLKKCKKSGK